VIINNQVQGEADTASSDQKRNPETRKEQAGKTVLKSLKNEKIINIWNHPVTINGNGFKYKSLSCWSINPFVGCQHACRFCYVPSVSAIRLKGQLAGLGVDDPDEQWGQYAFLRVWDESAFLSSLRAAEKTPIGELNADGNRAVMLSTTTDAYQTLRGQNPVQTSALNSQARVMVRRMLELIRDHSTLNVRILTRSPLAREDFDLYRTFGNRLLFGMSIPTLDDRLARLYEPKAPSPSRRLETLRLAVSKGIPVYAAVAPTYPEQGASELAAVLGEVGRLNPVTIFHEPINLRGGNIDRMRKEAEAIGLPFRGDVFENTERRVEYAIGQLRMAEDVACQLGLGDRFHPWPDESLGTQKQRRERGAEHDAWLDRCWSRISAWPSKNVERMAA
jgi:DNA repair photolyase